jgi:hypothetical protein
MLRRDVLAIAIAWLPLGACAGIGPIAMVGSEATAMSATKKTSLDNLISALTGADCAITNPSIGRNYCSDPPREEAEPERWCYRSLADITCYDAALTGNLTTRVR